MLQHPSISNSIASVGVDQVGSASLDTSTTSGHSIAPPSISDVHRTITLYCANCGDKRVVPLRCGRRSCPSCRRSSYHRHLRGYRDLAREMRDPKLLTLTKVTRETLTVDVIRDLRGAFRRLLHRRYFRERVRGGLYVIEAKVNSKGWNVHLHALIDSAYLEQAIVSTAWRELTGDSFIVDIRRVHSVRGGLGYILKYLLKPPALGGQEALYDAALKGTRLAQTFGVFYRAKVQTRPLACPRCGGAKWTSEFELRCSIVASREDARASPH